ncbi:tyrosine-type recombinase/integrase [Calycomorphotria hydatis]|nr:site-specific integrase [Calycomorphotria hydatis]
MRSLETDDEREALRLKANLEQTIRDVKSGRLKLPEDADVATFLLSDGNLTSIPDLRADEVEQTVLTLRELFENFFDGLTEGALEDSTIATMKTHRQNILRVLGEDIVADDIDLNSLDRFVRKRSREKGQRGHTIGAETMRKELKTLRQVWSWGQKRSLVSGDFPQIKEIRLPKTEEQPPFQTYAEIETQIAVEELSPEKQRELWEALYLRSKEIDELLDEVRLRAKHAFLYPMFVAAAHTGARRSELMRSKLSDIQKNLFVVRERKHRRGKITTRRVPMSSRLREALSDWADQHPGGPCTFGTMVEDESGNGKKLVPLTRDQANAQFQLVLKETKWNVIKGWHCLRHSFISNLASKGIDQRLIDEFVGHTTEEMRRRYRHLLPEVKLAAITNVFG